MGSIGGAGSVGAWVARIKFWRGQRGFIKLRRESKKMALVAWVHKVFAWKAWVHEIIAWVKKLVWVEKLCQKTKAYQVSKTTYYLQYLFRSYFHSNSVFFQRKYTIESAKWCAYLLTCFASFTCFECFTCSRAWRARVLYQLGVLTCLACFNKNGALGLLQKMACLVCFIKSRAWPDSKYCVFGVLGVPWRPSENGGLKVVKLLSWCV